ncbi:hypothetical protein I0D00_05960 [Pseudomonas lalucatii]|uniref:Cysteine dioxygenase n=1 Tax=Pseudomonas lalucatii TaxID=1424203 RepID=A0ABS5PYD8_9PSED|nr:hypothetical protein [Pseudomonas lalucatii]MBS7661495.1 hypothetical protein [Pseudomonas lalucatii]MBS7691837.1 hypothetical protein [Pseudomonas lalucatii]MBS7724049.1 hypothetical protein [Pseudomonas lalucatii]QVM87944.1 hypothetical protein I0D68_02965 [Pseudomonas lalucatii]
MTTDAYRLENFVADLRRIAAAAPDEASLLAEVGPLAQRVVQARDWLRDDMYQADAELGFGTTLLHVEPDQSLFVVVDSWLPGRGVRPHDHDTWAVVVGVEGVERNLFWRRLDDASRPGHAELECSGERRIGAGDVLLMPSGGIHSVINESARTSLSFHVYGRHLNHTRRRQFDPENKRELPFVISPR